MATDDDVRSAVIDELAWDPKIDNSEVAVSVTNGVVTLRGTVCSLAEKDDARKDAAQVKGAIKVDDALEVALLDHAQREDAQLRGTVMNALTINSRVRSSSINVQVDAGWVTLSGKVDWQFQKAAADQAASSIIGVCGVTNHVEVASTGADPVLVRDGIRKAMERRARLDAAAVSIETTVTGTVTLSGTVDSAAEHEDAMHAAWSAPGAVQVVDRLRVSP